MVAPVGTITVKLLEVAALDRIAVPLNRTVSKDAVLLKMVPVITTVVPAKPLEGAKLAILGSTLISEELCFLQPTMAGDKRIKK